MLMNLSTLLFSKDALNWSKSDSKDIYNSFQINAALSTFQSFKEFKKKIKITVNFQEYTRI